MNAEDYPPQEPFGDLAKSAHAILTERAAGVDAKDFNYGADPYQSVAVCPAEQPNGDVVLMIHGGGWVNGYKEWMNFMAPALNAADITFVSIGYRLAPQHMFPTAVEDCMDGLAWTHQSIAEHGGDPSRLFLGGHFGRRPSFKPHGGAPRLASVARFARRRRAGLFAGFRSLQVRRQLRHEDAATLPGTRGQRQREAGK